MQSALYFHMPHARFSCAAQSTYKEQKNVLFNGFSILNLAVWRWLLVLTAQNASPDHVVKDAPGYFMDFPTARSPETDKF